MDYEPTIAVSKMAELLPMMRRNMAACKSSSFFLSSPMILPRLALGKWTLVFENDSHYFNTGDGKIILPPTPDFRDYVSAILAAARPGATLLRVPAYVAHHLKKTKFKVSTATTEYMLDRNRLTHLPGRDLKRIRNYANAAEDLTGGVSVTAQDVAMFVKVRELNNAWYRDANTRMFRTYEKKNIDWLFDNWKLVANVDPDILLTVTWREDKELESFHIGTTLCDEISTTFTERYNRQGMRGANIVGLRRTVARLGCLKINDGTADSPGIRDLKMKLSGGETIKTFNIEVPRR